MWMFFWHNRRKRIEDKLDLILRKEESIMSGLTDLQDVVVKLQADLTFLQATVQAAITAIQTAGDPDAAVEAAAQALQAVDAALGAANTSLAAALPPVTPPA
jgi:predicted  nucleic acid-binding Zn-ribbon protein